MFTKTLISLGAALVLVTALGSAAHAETDGQDWWRAYQSSQKGCVSGEESTTSAYPAWMVCR
jgi:hypothetical protein